MRILASVGNIGNLVKESEKFTFFFFFFKDWPSVWFLKKEEEGNGKWMKFLIDYYYYFFGRGFSRFCGMFVWYVALLFL
jgi:hypothetical protein